MTTLILVRHGQSESNLEKDRIAGRANLSPLTAEGEHQARLLGGYFRSIELEPVYVAHSGAVRSHDTAQISLEQAHIDIVPAVDERLHEMSQGEYEGLLRTDVYTPEFIAQLKSEGLDARAPGGESIHEVQARMVSAIREAHERHPNGVILFFSHGLSIRSLVGYTRGYTRDQILTKLETDNATLTEVRIVKGIPKIPYVGKNVISA